MFFLIVKLLISLAVVVFGAELLIDNASIIARKTGLSEFIIGALIVGFGTSCPELVVSLTGALEGNSDIAIGNVLGSNVFNTLLILGLSLIVSPILVSKENRLRDIPLLLIGTGLFCVLSIIGSSLSMVDGIILVVFFGLYLFTIFKTNNKYYKQEIETTIEEPEIGYLKPIILTIIGIVGLICGGKYFVDYAVKLAEAIGTSDKFIAITVLAIGTSLPEFVTCLMAIIKKKSQMALGDIIGSNIFNLILILGTSAIICPITFTNIGTFDLVALLLSSGVFAIGLSNKYFKRTDGIIWVLLFCAYFVYLFKTNLV